MIRLSTTFKTIILLNTIYMLGLITSVFGDAISRYDLTIQLMICLAGFVCAIYVTQKSSFAKKNRDMLHSLNVYVGLYSIVILFYTLYSFVLYKYSVSTILFSLTPYLYIYWVYPLLFIYYVDGNCFRFLKQIFFLVIITLALKSLCWYLYNYHSIVLASNIVFQYGNWTRNGKVRIDPGYLFGLALAFSLYRIHCGKKGYGFVLAGLLLFLIFITQFRYQLIVAIIVIVVVYSFSAKTDRRKGYRALITGLLLVGFIAFGGLDYLYSVFSASGSYGKSSLARVETLAHVFDLYRRHPILGIGWLTSDSELLARSVNERLGFFATKYYLADIGILSGVFTFGFAAIPLYGYLFHKGIKTCRKVLHEGSPLQLTFLLGIVIYLIVSCFGLNVFDRQRAYNLPFDLSIIVFYSMLMTKKESFESLRDI